MYNETWRGGEGGQDLDRMVCRKSSVRSGRKEAEVVDRNK